MPASDHAYATTESTFPRRFGRYVLLSHLGEGGMGRAYLALSRDRGGERLVVVKRFGNPRARLAPDQVEENQHRFRREAQITMALAHRCIARTLAYKQAGNDSYLVQEFVRGMTLQYLASSVAEGGERIPVPLAAHTVCELARALDYVHEFHHLGLVHRDLTPSNVIVSQAGEVKVIDFGIAKATFAADTVTNPGVLVGKPLWMAPEVLDGKKPDRRADLYALGIIFWYLVAGRDPEALLAEGVALPSPSRFNPEVPLKLDEIVMQAIDAKPECRFQSARTFFEATVPFVPAGYEGQEELAKLVARYQPVLEKTYFAEVVARGRPILDQIQRRRWWGRAPILASLLLAALLGPLVVLRPRPSAQRSTVPIPPAAAPLPPPPEAKSPPPATAPIQEPQQVPAQPALGLRTEDPVPKLQHPRKPSASQPLAAAAPSMTVAPAESAESLLDSALEAMARGENQEALSRARASVQKRQTPDAYILIGRILFESDPDRAKAALASALQLAPSNRQAARLLEDLRSRTP